MEVDGVAEVPPLLRAHAVGVLEPQVLGSFQALVALRDQRLVLSSADLIDRIPEVLRYVEL